LGYTLPAIGRVTDLHRLENVRAGRTKLAAVLITRLLKQSKTGRRTIHPPPRFALFITALSLCLLLQPQATARLNHINKATILIPKSSGLQYKTRLITMQNTVN
jgi:hypothetical protein